MAHDLGFQSLAESRSHYKHTQGPDPARHAENFIQPLFRALTKDDLLASSVQPLPETRVIGFKAWNETYGPHRIGNPAPAMQRKETRQNPSIRLTNKERTKNTARADRDAPQCTMSVLKSNRKRTMGELGCNELVSPAQIESPSERLARIAKKRRQRQERCDIWSQDTTTRNTQSKTDFGHVHGFENGRTTGENADLAESLIVNEPLDRRETVARMGDERRGPLVVCEPSPVNTYPLRKGQRVHASTQRVGNTSDGYMDADGLRPTQITAQNHNVQEHGHGDKASCSSGGVNREPKDRKPRICGPTDVCGVFSPEKKPPVKRSTHGEFHCPRCDSQYTTSNSVNYHFETCIAKYGNPKSLKWNDHPSLENIKKGNVSKNHEIMTTVPAPVPDIQEGSASSLHDLEPVGGPATNHDMVAPSPISNIQAPSRLGLAEPRSITGEPASHAGTEVRIDHQASIIKHRETAGKGLSAETLKSFRETGSWNRGVNLNGSLDEVQDEETEVPNIAYRYFVLKREWLETEEDAIELRMGPYHTLSEANAVANAEVQCPHIDGFEGVQSKGWSYYYKEDEHGMQLHMATVLGVTIEAVVRRGK